MPTKLARRLLAIVATKGTLIAVVAFLLGLGFLAREPIASSAVKTLDRMGRSAEMQGQVSVSLTKTVADIALKTVR